MSVYLLYIPQSVVVRLWPIRMDGVGMITFLEHAHVHRRSAAIVASTAGAILSSHCLLRGLCFGVLGDLRFL